jgi:hypothetical protein
MAPSGSVPWGGFLRAGSWRPCCGPCEAQRLGYDISEVYVAPAKGKDWTDDILGEDELEDGNEKLIRVNRPEKTCFWDLKIVYSEDDSEAIWYDIDLCKISKVTIKYDRKRDKTTAFFD